MPSTLVQGSVSSPVLLDKLWIYTNYNCNLSCAYCLAKSTPRASSQAIALETVKRLVDEAAVQGITSIYFTGGEPFLLEDIFAMLEYASQRMETTVLTNAMLFKGLRLQQLNATCRDSLVVQVSLDGSAPQQHDPYRGRGSWAKTVEGLLNLQRSGFRLRLSTTVTPANVDHLAEICAFHLALGIPEVDHIIRPLAKRGFSQQGMEVSKQTLSPELTINQDGVYWHPISTDPDLRVSQTIFPLADAIDCLQSELESIRAGQPGMKTFQ